jgi:hypothetical protein
VGMMLSNRYSPRNRSAGAISLLFGGRLCPRGCGEGRKHSLINRHGMFFRSNARAGKVFAGQ